MTILFIDEFHLKNYIKITENKKLSYEYYSKRNRNEMLKLNSKLCFLFDKYDELYNHDTDM